MYRVKLVDIFNVQKVSILMQSDLAVYQLDFCVLQSSSFKIPISHTFCLGSLSMTAFQMLNQAAQANSFCLTFFFLNQDSVEYCIIGVTILSQLTNEINQVSATAFLIGSKCHIF